jgi:ABC-2 type transport system ATP-binding protein
VSTLSGGMRRRLDLARALLPEPRLLLLDEPTVGIDEASFRAFWARIEDYRAHTGATLLLATHRPEEAEMCSRVALFARGKVVEVEDPAALKRKLSRDVLVVTTEVPQAVEEGLLALGLKARSVGKRVFVEAEAAHALVPRVVEAFPQGTLTSVELRAASMADVFLKVTGQHLEN